MIRRLRIKFVCINMAIVTVMLCVIFSTILFFMGAGMENQNQHLLEQMAERTHRPEPPVEDWGALRRPHFSVRLDSSGAIAMVDSGFFQELEEDALREYTQAALKSGKKSGLLREYALRFRQMEEPAGGKTILFADASMEISTMEHLLKTCLLISGASFVLFFIISVLLARWAVKPVEEAWNQQRQFVADASHELKTPLTVIMTNAELLQSGMYPETEKQQFAGSILTMSRQMRGLVESLLELARVDNGTAKMRFGQLDLSEVVGECLLPFEPVYFEKDLLLESAIEPGLHVKGSGSHLRQVVDILLDNAQKYSTPGGITVLTLKRQGNHALLSVSNPGEAIAPEDLKNIFKRFYRIDKARTMNRSYGLGLAIAQSIVTEHKGRIWAQSSGGRNTFFVQLPLSGSNC